MIAANPKGPNPLRDWRLDLADIQTIGVDLQRPECILAEPDGTLWSADARGGVMKISADGTQELITQTVDGHFDLDAGQADSLLYGTLPNGLAFADNGDSLISNFGTDLLEVMSRSGETRTLYDSIDGQPMGKVNFVLRDSKNRIWITVSTKINPWSEAIRNDIDDGYIALVDDKGIRIVADGLSFTNEIRLDADEQWMYIAETCGKRVSRMRVQDDGTLTDYEIYGPSDLGKGLIDGLAFDAFGNIWLTMIFADQLLAITPEGDALTLFEDGNAEATEKFEREFASGGAVSFDTLAKTGGQLAPWLASVTFGGPDLKTVYLGSLKGNTIPYFRSPVAGLPMAHWSLPPR